MLQEWNMIAIPTVITMWYRGAEAWHRSATLGRAPLLCIANRHGLWDGQPPLDATSSIAAVTGARGMVRQYHPPDGGPIEERKVI